MTNLITLLMLAPLAAATVILVIPHANTRLIRATCGAANILQLVLLMILWTAYASADPGPWHCVERATWFDLRVSETMRIKAEYLVGLDGLGLALVSLSVVVFAVATASSHSIVHKAKGYFVLLLILNAALIGSFSSLDFLLFFVFFEFMLVPLYFLIGIWGGPNREYASIKFFLYTFLGSIFILISIIVLALSSGAPDGSVMVHTFNLNDLVNPDYILPDSILRFDSSWTLGPWSGRMWIFLLLFVGFAIKLPVVPLHTWLPDAHVEAPTPVSIVLAALVLKVGGYGLIRFAYPLFPDEAAYSATWIAGLAVLSIIYGALNAMASKDLKRLVAYSSVSHMGFVLLGIVSFNAEGISGAVFQMVSHGILSSMLFFLAGALSDRTGDRTISNYSGLSQRLPRYAGFVMVAFVASLGLPGFSGFIGELFVLIGALRDDPATIDLVPQWMGILAALGLLLGAAYFLWTYQRMFLGPYAVNHRPLGAVEDLKPREVAVLLPLAAGALILGIFPDLLLRWINPFSIKWVELVQSFVNP